MCSCSLFSTFLLSVAGVIRAKVSNLESQAHRLQFIGRKNVQTRELEFVTRNNSFHGTCGGNGHCTVTFNGSFHWTQHPRNETNALGSLEFRFQPGYITSFWDEAAVSDAICGIVVGPSNLIVQ